MRIFPPEPKVALYKDGFEDQDILDRAAVGKSLSKFVERIQDPIVVALDGGWGTGKTYFLKRWVGAHALQNEGSAKTVYFDAFANDYLSDPLPALVSALSERFPKEDKDTLERIKASAFKLAKPLARLLLATATSGATAALPPVGDAAANALSDEASNALKKYWSQEDGRRAAMEEFRSALTELVKPQSDAEVEDGPIGARMVIVVDELDRCRPDYALEVLEVIKHFFAIPGVIFILGVNLLALEHSVTAKYGSGIDASAYLRKFIHVSLSLPSEIEKQHNRKSVVLAYLEHNLSEMGIRNQIANRLKSHVKIVARNNNISVRDIGKILSSISLLRDNILQDENISWGWIEVIVSLLVSRVVAPEMFNKFLNASVTTGDLEQYFDATSNRLSRESSGRNNPNFDRYTQRTFYLWKYIQQNGQFHAETNPYEADLGRAFGDFSPDDPRSIPEDVYRRWIDLFVSFGVDV